MLLCTDGLSDTLTSSEISAIVERYDGDAARVALELVDAVLTLQPALKILGARERRILRMRFVDNLTQEQIGHRLGVSQMQVSRLLAGILATLRNSMQYHRPA